MNVLPWKTWKTTAKKIKEEGFPAYHEDNRYYFEVEEVEIWFKKKKFVKVSAA